MQRDVYDAIVIDKIFQPICDSMAEKISCFKISHFLLDGMPIFFLYAHWPQTYEKIEIFVFMFVMAASFYFYMMLKRAIRTCERTSRPNMVNTGRYLLFPIRTILTVIMVLSLVSARFEGAIPDMLGVLGLYFGSCSFNPRQFKRTKTVLQPV